MAVIWSRRESNVLYQVRNSGSTLRLYTDGILHTQFNPRRIVTGSVWDLLWLPVFFRADPCVNRVLLLGAGAGTVIRQIDALFSPQEIIAVENNPIHLEIAQKFFGVTTQMATLNLAEASTYVRRYQGKKFDLIIDDLFVAAGGVAKRALYCDHLWLKQLTRHLTSKGVLCLNFADRSEFSKAPLSEYLAAGGRFANAYALTCPRTENVIAAMLPERSDIESLRAHIRVTTALSGLIKSGQWQFEIELFNQKKRKA